MSNIVIVKKSPIIIRVADRITIKGCSSLRGFTDYTKSICGVTQCPYQESWGILWARIQLYYRLNVAATGHFQVNIPPEPYLGRWGTPHIKVVKLFNTLIKLGNLQKKSFFKWPGPFFAASLMLLPSTGPPVCVQLWAG